MLNQKIGFNGDCFICADPQACTDGSQEFPTGDILNPTTVMHKPTCEGEILADSQEIADALEAACDLYYAHQEERTKRKVWEACTGEWYGQRTSQMRKEEERPTVWTSLFEARKRARQLASLAIQSMLVNVGVSEEALRRTRDTCEAYLDEVFPY